MEFIKNIGAKGEIVIPKILRERYKMNVGDELIAIAKEDGILIKKTR
jgi:AbrB family looped-hinge helix DNA binding protein